MRDINQVLRDKELIIEQVRREVVALRLVAPLLEETENLPSLGEAILPAETLAEAPPAAVPSAAEQAEDFVDKMRARAAAASVRASSRSGKDSGRLFWRNA